MDTVIFEIPDNYKVEYIPDGVTLNTPYGEYQSKVEIIRSSIIYSRRFVWNKGVFPAEEYQNVRTFYKTVSSADENKIVLIKKS